MKKIYLRPVLNIKVVRHINYLCAGSEPLRQTSPSAEWGDQGQFAPSEWIDEGHGGGNTGGYNTTVIEEDDEDLFSRGKAWGGWDYNW